MKEIKSGDITVYDYEGSGSPLLFVHAFPMNNKMWNEQVSEFKNKYRVITYDIRGFGKSKDSFKNIYTMETFANDVLEIIEKLDLKNVNICGLSMGGYIVQRAVLKARENFSSMVLADSKAERDDDKGMISRSRFIDRLMKEGIGNFADEFMKRLLYEKNYQNPGLYKFIKDVINEQSAKALAGASIAMATRTSTTEQLKGLELPVLLIVGEQDTFSPIPNTERMHKLIKNSVMKIIPESGHLTPIENTKIFNKYLSEFLSQIS